MITPEEFQNKLLAYTDEVKLFFHAYGLGDLVIDKQVDHAAIKGLNRKEYDAYVEAFLPISKRLSYEPVGARDIAVAELYDPFDCGTFGTTALVEIMEPKPGGAVTTHDMVDHFELLVLDLDAVMAILKDKGVSCERQANPNHDAIVVEINEWGQEIKFTDTSLLRITEKHIASGKALIHK